MDLRSENGVLAVDLAFRSDVDAHGRVRYCYIYRDGVESPNLRLHPGDLLILRLNHDLMPPVLRLRQRATRIPLRGTYRERSVRRSTMNATSTNLHFHGLTVPPTCHQDDVLHTSVQPADAPFEYRVRIPMDQPPGLYWYHPHLHGFTRAQVVGGASGALIVEGMERANGQVSGLPERVFVIRDEDLLNPGAAPSANARSAPPAILDRDGDARNTGDGSGIPAKDLSLNFVSVPYPPINRHRYECIRQSASSGEL